VTAASVTASAPPALELTGISKAFGNLRALQSASLEVFRGQIAAVLGENGAGKTTLMRVAFGLVRADSGQIRIDGKLVSLPSPSSSARLGIGMVHQHFTLVPAMTAAENVALGQRGIFDERATAARIRAIGEETGLVLDPGAVAGDLSAGAQQRLEIIKALARGAQTLILDEPTAVLTLDESRELMAFLRGFVDRGGAAVLITHKLREALGIADRVCVMRDGRTVLELPRAAATEQGIIRAMLGEQAPEAARREVEGSPQTSVDSASRGSASHAVVTAENVVVHDGRGVPVVNGVSFTLRRGEMVGLAGAEGSGHRWLLRAIAGRVVTKRGILILPGRIGFIPEDRYRDAMIQEWSLLENMALSNAESRSGLMPWRQLRDTTRDLLESFDVRADSSDTIAGTLSGGNQQKLVLARELASLPDLLVAEQPTRGLDIAATAAVHQRLTGAVERGAAVIVSSADLEELVALSDRVLVMFNGELVETERDIGAVGRAMIGVS
jgi:simple sugar transport system ATP-binding protein